MKIYHHLRNPIIRHSGSSVWEKLPIPWVIITIQHANCFSIGRLCFQWILLSTTGLHLDCYLMRAALIKDGSISDFSINREALSQALTFGNILVSRLLLKYCIFQDHSRNHHIHSLSLRIISAWNTWGINEQGLARIFFLLEVHVNAVTHKMLFGVSMCNEIFSHDEVDLSANRAWILKHYELISLCMYACTYDAFHIYCKILCFVLCINLI